MAEDQELKEPLSQKVETVGIVVIKDGKILTVRNIAGTVPGEGVWSLPGGKKRTINKETDREATVRKLYRETGLITTPERLIEFPGNYFEIEANVYGNLKNMSWRVFLCTDFSGELLPERKNEVKPQWVDIKRFNFLYETAPNTPEVILNAQKYLKEENY